MNTIPPNDFSFYEMLDALVQEQPASALDPDIGGQFAAIGIVKGKPFKPDARMRKILTDAVAIGNAAGRTFALRPRESEGFGYYGAASKWLNPLFVGGYDFTRPPPEITKDGRQAVPRHGRAHARCRGGLLLCGDRRDAGDGHARCPTSARSTCSASSTRAASPSTAAKTYKVSLPADIPAAKFWSLTVYDNHRARCCRPTSISPRGQPELPEPGGGGGCRRHDDGLFRPEQARRRQGRQLDPDAARQGLVRDPAALQPAGAVLRQDLASERDRARHARRCARSGAQERRGALDTLPVSGRRCLLFRRSGGAPAATVVVPRPLG